MERLGSLKFEELLARVGAKTPAPGGGAVASAVGALGAALARMVVAYSSGKKELAEHHPALERSAESLGRTIQLLMTLADEDARAYALVNELSRLDRDDARRAAEYTGAVEGAIQAPRNVVAACCDLLRLMEGLVGRTNPLLRSDLAIGAILAESAARAGGWNVRVNLGMLLDANRRASLDAELSRLLADAAARRASIERACD